MSTAQAAMTRTSTLLKKAAASVVALSLLAGCTIDRAPSDQAKSSSGAQATSDAGSGQGRGPKPTLDASTSSSASSTSGSSALPSSPSTARPTKSVTAPELYDVIRETKGSSLAELGVAVTQLQGASLGSTESAGDLMTGPAWSTAKVPVAIAALRKDSSQVAQVHPAIRSSDNNAAEALWASLGTPSEAATRTQNILKEGGDTATKVQSERVRDGFSAFGQTEWALINQSRFATYLPQLNSAAPVLEDMGNVDSSQRYGLGQVQGARFKGGWGPDDNGKYLVRQFGLVPTRCGDVGVAVAAKSRGGSYEDGSALLNDLVKNLMPVLEKSC